MDKTNLIPCPFCGGMGVVQELDYGWMQLRDNEYCVECKSCHAKTDFCSSVRNATYHWNNKEVKE